ncbi:MAG: hypothetical protein ABUL62_01220 [Myxococcales bacterium]
MPENETRPVELLVRWLERWRHAIGWVALIGLTVLALDRRCHAFFVNPDLRAEDGKSVIAFFYSHWEVQRLWRVKAGYVPFMPNVLGYTAVRLPPPIAPYFMTLVPVIFTVAAFCILKATAFRRHVASDRLRTVCCFAVALAPIGSFFLVCHTDYSIWNLFILLLWLVILPLPERKWRAALVCVLMAILIWSHPLSIAALPPTLYWLWADKRRFQRGLCALVVAIQALHVIYGTHAETTALAHGHESLFQRGLSALQLCGNVYLDTVSGSVFPYLQAISPLLGRVCAGALLLALTAAAVFPRRLRVSRGLLLWVLYCIAVPHLMVALTRASGLWSSRYVYLMRMFALIGFCILLWEGLTALVAKLQRFPRLRMLSWLPEVLVIGFCLSLNRPGSNALYEQQTPENGQVIRACFAELGRLQHERGSRCNLVVPCRKRGGDWAFTLDSRRTCTD